MASIGAEPKPFLKWVGGKRQLLPELLKHVPDQIKTYYEPFLGGGALFFHLAAQQKFNKAVLSDVNLELVTTYRTVRDRVETLIRLLGEMSYEKQEYYERRDQIPSDAVAVAARMIYLNRCGFNGLYRVNKSGKFNVPFGRYTNPTICDADGLRAASEALQFAHIICCDYATACSTARRGDFVYLDPPYVPASETANFAQYHSSSFGTEDHQKLAKLYRHLRARGVNVLLSNSDTDETRQLYRGLEHRRIEARRNVNSSGSKRGPVGELLVFGGDAA